MDQPIVERYIVKWTDSKTQKVTEYTREEEEDKWVLFSSRDETDGLGEQEHLKMRPVKKMSPKEAKAWGLSIHSETTFPYNRPHKLNLRDSDQNQWLKKTTTPMVLHSFVQHFPLITHVNRNYCVSQFKPSLGRRWKTHPQVLSRQAELGPESK